MAKIHLRTLASGPDIVLRIFKVSRQCGHRLPTAGPHDGHSVVARAEELLRRALAECEDVEYDDFTVKSTLKTASLLANVLQVQG